MAVTQTMPTTRPRSVLALAAWAVAFGPSCSKRHGGATETCETPGPRGWASPDQRPKASGPSPGCRKPRGSGGLQRRTLTVDGQERSYLLAPASAVPDGEGAPLVFVFHGLGGSPDRIRSRMGLESAVRGRAILVYPQGLPIADFGGNAGWNLATQGNDFTFFDKLLETVADESCVDLGRVFATGHSFGGWMTNRLGFARGSRLRGIAPSAGGLSPRDCGGRPLAAMVLHARNDPTVAFAEGKAAHAMWAKAAGCRPGMRTPGGRVGPCAAHEGCAAEAPVWMCEHDQLHAWPDFGAAAVWTFFEGLR
jgi:poly(3-hydroxybutyrate) depolymerase